LCGAAPSGRELSPGARSPASSSAHAEVAAYRTGDQATSPDQPPPGSATIAHLPPKIDLALPERVRQRLFSHTPCRLDDSKPGVGRGFGSLSPASSGAHGGSGRRAMDDAPATRRRHDQGRAGTSPLFRTSASHLGRARYGALRCLLWAAAPDHEGLRSKLVPVAGVCAPAPRGDAVILAGGWCLCARLCGCRAHRHP
jgi:hypothetical protein